jgi:hypothetical protein
MPSGCIVGSVGMLHIEAVILVADVDAAGWVRRLMRDSCLCATTILARQSDAEPRMACEVIVNHCLVVVESLQVEAEESFPAVSAFRYLFFEF